MCIQITIFSQTSVKLTHDDLGFLNNEEVQWYFFPSNFDYILYLNVFYCSQQVVEKQILFSV